MVQAKIDLFDDTLIYTAGLFKALSHPARLQILQFLADTKTCITNDISEELPLGRTTVNQHLKELKDIGLITGHIEGTRTKYCLNPHIVTDLSRAISDFVNRLDIKNYKCD